MLITADALLLINRTVCLEAMHDDMHHARNRILTVVKTA